MKTEPQISPPETVLLPESQSETTEKPKSKRRPRGKIANLPKVLRDRVNAMLDDGFTYGQIIEKLKQSTDPPLPYPISEMNLSNWEDHGYPALSGSPGTC